MEENAPSQTFKTLCFLCLVLKLLEGHGLSSLDYPAMHNRDPPSSRSLNLIHFWHHFEINLALNSSTGIYDHTRPRNLRNNLITFKGCVRVLRETYEILKSKLNQTLKTLYNDSLQLSKTLQFFTTLYNSLQLSTIILTLPTLYNSFNSLQLYKSQEIL